MRASPPFPAPWIRNAHTLEARRPAGFSMPQCHYRGVCPGVYPVLYRALVGRRHTETVTRSLGQGAGQPGPSRGNGPGRPAPERPWDGLNPAFSREKWLEREFGQPRIPPGACALLGYECFLQPLRRCANGSRRPRSVQSNARTRGPGHTLPQFATLSIDLPWSAALRKSRRSLRYVRRRHYAALHNRCAIPNSCGVKVLRGSVVCSANRACRTDPRNGCVACNRNASQVSAWRCCQRLGC